MKKLLLGLALLATSTTQLIHTTPDLPVVLESNSSSEQTISVEEVSDLLNTYAEESSLEELAIIQVVFATIAAEIEAETEDAPDSLVFAGNLMKKIITFIEARIERGASDQATHEESQARQDVIDFCSKHPSYSN